MTGRCDGSPVDTSPSGSPTWPELHLFGIDASDPPPYPTVSVRSDRPTDLALTFSSDEPAHRAVEVDPAATLEGIVPGRSKPPTMDVVGTAGNPLVAPIRNRSPYANHGFGVVACSTAPGDPANRTRQRVREVEADAGLTSTGFYGCCHAKGFQLR